MSQVYVPNIIVRSGHAVMLNSHPLAKKRSIFIRELANERFILNERNHSPFAFDRLITLWAEAGFSPRIGATATNAAGVVALVEAGRA
jgi:DNA-binding transcriptional LysR family regulator